MAVRKPLVAISGRFKELPTGDTVAGTVDLSTAQSVGGVKTLTSALLFADGSAGGPSFSFTSDTGANTGLYWSGQNEMSFTANGAQRVKWGTFGCEIVSGGMTLSSGDLAVSHSGTVLTDFNSTDGGAVQFRVISSSATNRRFLGQSSAGVTESQMNFGAGEVHFWGSSTLVKLLHISGTSVDPDEDNGKSCGTASLRWSAVYSMTPATSDNSDKCATTAFVRAYAPSGTYTPTLTNTTNIAASAANAAQYMRVGDIVTVSGQVTIDPTAASTASVLGVSLPIPSNFSSAIQCSGVAACNASAGLCAAIQADATNDTAILIWVTTADAASRVWTFTFTYRVL
jgi:hypothetical protein